MGALGLLCALAFPLVRGALSQPSRYEGKIVRGIEFTGIKNVEERDLLNVLITEVGYPLKSSEVRQDIKSVFKQGQFENVEVQVEPLKDGVRVRFICTERPIIKKIIYRGIDELNDTELADTSGLKEGEVLRLDKLENAVKLIKKKYTEKGLFNAIVRYEIHKTKKDPTYVEVAFIIDEGEEVRVAKISIFGAHKIAAAHLRRAMETEEEGLFKDGEFKSDVYEQDKGKILGLYREKGYLDAQIVEDRVEYEWKNPEKKDKRVIFITIKVTEGERYYFDKYTLAGNKVVESFVLQEQFEQNKPGAVFNDTKFQRDRQMISFNYATKGYIFARVVPKRNIEEREVLVRGVRESRKFVRIDFEIEEGSQAYIENIIIKGNKKTKERVIRRELVIEEGELFNSFKMQISRERVYNLGYFKQVNFDVRPGSREGYMNLIVDVEEQPTGTISLGGGYGTTSGFSIFADLGEKNLRGNGWNTSVRVEYGPQKKSLTLSFTEPWLFDKPMGFNVQVFGQLYNLYTNSMFSDSSADAEYTKLSMGYSLGMSYRFWYFYGVGAVWTHAFKRIIDPSGDNADEIFREENLGMTQKRTITLYTYRDTKDNYMNPTRGGRIEFSVGFTGGVLLRGNDHFVKYSPEFYWYVSPFHLPFLKTHPCVFEFRASGSFLTPPFMKGTVSGFQDRMRDEWVEAEERLQIGGPETLRGWDLYDDKFPDSWQDGLYHRILYGVEFRVPVHPQMLWFVLFFDAGSLWTDGFWEKGLDYSTQMTHAKDRQSGDLHNINRFFNVDLMSYFRYSWGFGFKIQIPMMPLRFWFGKKLVWVGKDHGFFRQEGDLNFQFGIGDMRF